MKVELTPQTFDHLKHLIEATTPPQDDKAEVEFFTELRKSFEAAARNATERDERDHDIGVAIGQLNEAIEKIDPFPGNNYAINSMIQFRRHLMRIKLMDMFRDLSDELRKWDDGIDYRCEFKMYIEELYKMLQAGLDVCSQITTLNNLDDTKKQIAEECNCVGDARPVKGF